MAQINFCTNIAEIPHTCRFTENLFFPIICLQVFCILFWKNLYLQELILVCLFKSSPYKIWLIIFISPCIIKRFRSFNPKVLNEKTSFFGCKSKILHQCVACLSYLSIFEIKEGHFMKLWKLITWLIWLDGKKTPLKFYLRSSLFFSKYFSISTFDISKLIINHYYTCIHVQRLVQYFPNQNLRSFWSFVFLFYWHFYYTHLGHF